MTEEYPLNHEASEKKEAIIQALISGLKATHELHESLGESGTVDFQENQFGEKALTMDVQSEEKIIDELKETNIPMNLVSEEHGQFSTGENPLYTVSLDGLDGSGEYKGRRGESMYGAMVCVLEGDNPTYDDYVAAGVMIHSPNPNLLLAIKGQGVFSVDLSTGERKQISRDNDKQFSEQAVIDLDRNWPPYRQLLDKNSSNFPSNFPNMQCAFFSSAARLALFVEGKIDLGLEWTRKQNLEQAVMYAFAREVGGVMTAASGVSIGSEKYKTFRQDIHVPLIVAPNQEMASVASRRFNLPSLQSYTYDKIG